jgi:putative NADH-flavin reductase
VTAFSRHADQIGGVATIAGDATNPDDVHHAVAGHDAVVSPSSGSTRASEMVLQRHRPEVRRCGHGTRPGWSRSSA